MSLFVFALSGIMIKKMNIHKNESDILIDQIKNKFYIFLLPSSVQVILQRLITAITDTPSSSISSKHVSVAQSSKSTHSISFSLC